jgi:hypothetical protein
MNRSNNGLKNLALTLALAILPACGNSGGISKPDARDAHGSDTSDAPAMGTDVAGPDVGATEVGAHDTGATVDTGAHDTTATLDTGATVDTGAHDTTATLDTGATVDTGAHDTAATVDTGAAVDTGTADAGSDANLACAQTRVALGAATSFVVLGGSTVTNTGLTVVTGDLGVSPGTAVTGFGPGTVVGVQHANDPTAAQAEADLTTAYNDAAGRTLCPVAVAGNLGGQTLAPGLYKSTGSLEISSGDLTLDARGDGNAVFIFQMASTLTTSAGRQVILSGGARSTNVFWQVGTSATLGTTSSFQGTVMADQSITLATGATLNGRVLARIAAVNLDTNAIVRPTP